MASISKNTIVITIVIFLTIAGVSICLAMYSDEIKNNESKVLQEECKHDWVVTSKYVLLRDSYKTISKCSKCGKEID